MSRRRVAVKSLPKGGKPRYRSAVVRGVKTLSETDASRRRLSTQNVVFSSAAPRKTLYGSESGCRRRRRKVFGSKFLLWVSTQLRTSKSRMQWLWGSEHGGREEACGLRIRSVGSGLPLVVFSGGRETDTLRFPFVGRLFVFQAPKNRPVTPAPSSSSSSSSIQNSPQTGRNQPCTRRDLLLRGSGNRSEVLERILGASRRASAAQRKCEVSQKQKYNFFTKTSCSRPRLHEPVRR